MMSNRQIAAVSGGRRQKHGIAQAPLWAWGIDPESPRHKGHSLRAHYYISIEPNLVLVFNAMPMDVVEAPRPPIGLPEWFGGHMMEAWCLHDDDDVVDLQHEESLEEKFHRLVGQWREETAGLSSPPRITGNPAYLSIVALTPKPRVISLILMELRDHGGFWYPALRALTDQNPVPGSARGRPRLMKEAWLAWGKQYELLD